MRHYDSKKIVDRPTSLRDEFSLSDTSHSSSIDSDSPTLPESQALEEPNTHLISIAWTDGVTPLYTSRFLPRFCLDIRRRRANFPWTSPSRHFPGIQNAWTASIAGK